MEEWLARFGSDLLARIGGPLTFRLIVQPLVATCLAIRAGIRDAHAGRPAYLWAILTDSSHRGALVRSGLADVGKVFILAAAIDWIYQIVVTGEIRFAQSFTVAVSLALVPYLFGRDVTRRIAEHVLGIHPQSKGRVY
jgi:hypothetical protein